MRAPRKKPSRLVFVALLMTPVAELGPGEVGYLINGIKDVGQARSGETVTLFHQPAAEPLPGYRDPKPMVFCGLYPIDGDDFENLRESLEKLKLNDASLTYEPESPGALALGFASVSLVCCTWRSSKSAWNASSTWPSSPLRPALRIAITRTDGTLEIIDNPADLPPPQKIDFIEEPYFRVSIITPKEYTGTLMDLCQTRRGDMTKLEYLSPERVELHYRVPLAEVVIDFFDQMKSRTQGYASLDYELDGYERSDLVLVDLLLNGERADAFSTIVHRDRAYEYGRRLCEKLCELIPRQMFDVPDSGRDRWQNHRPSNGKGAS